MMGNKGLIMNDILNENSTLSQLNDSWQDFFKQEFKQPYMAELAAFLQNEKYEKHVVYPNSRDIFNAFQFTSLDNLKVVIVGQDPYHGQGQAHGLSFSVPAGIKIPPSLRNIFKELNRDLQQGIPSEGNLEKWAKQGVLLLNASLTVREAQAGSHSKKGWLHFSDHCIQYINEHKKNVVFLSWGLFAHKVCAQVDRQKHCVIKTSHPSPLGASKAGKEFCAFLGSHCFSLCNDYLSAHELTPIDWALAEQSQLSLYE